jgi:outer membrane lipoprotein-sorting protein
MNLEDSDKNQDATLLRATVNSASPLDEAFLRRLKNDSTKVFQAAADRRKRQRRLILTTIRWFTPSAAAAAILMLAFGLSGLWSQKEASASQIMTAAATVASKLDSVHIQLRARMIPGDNFQMFSVDYDFVPVDMWKQFVPAVRWRIDLPTVALVMDGSQTLTLTNDKPSHVIKSEVSWGPGGPFLSPLMNVDKLLDDEKMAQKNGRDLTLAHQQGKDGARKLLVTVDRKANVGPDDWCRNHALEGSDTRRVYTFDAKTKFLEGLQIYAKTKDADVLVLEITKVEYNPKIEPTVFAPDIPDDAIWFAEPQALPDNEKYAKMTPEEAVRAFFEACGKEDWDEVLKFTQYMVIPQSFKEHLGGLKIVSIGKAFKSGGYHGYYVPYEIKLKNGETKKFNLAVSNRNQGHRYVEDGGI